MGNQLPTRGKDSEDGYMLLAVLFMLFLLTLSLSVAIPQITKSIQRDREIETMHRGKQYIRAIQLYYRKFGSYPPSIDALVKTDNIRFLRKRYLDPLTGKDDWKPIHFGQNKAPIAMGFFGQPLGGLTGTGTVAGTGPSGGGIPSMGSSNGMGSSFGSSFGSGMGSSPTGSSLFGSSDNSGNTSGAATGTGSTSDQTTGSSSTTSTTTGTGSTNSGTGFMSGQNGQTFGGGGIIGVEPPVDKPSILVYKTKQRYNQWEFTYSPLMDQKQRAGAGNVMGNSSTTTNGNGANSTGISSGSGDSSGASDIFGSPGGSFGGSTSTGSSPTQQPQ